jgi:hypothetical protein
MRPGTEDASIMFERARLEGIWTNALTEENRLAWLNRWTVRPPSDAVGRRYVLDERQTLKDTVRPPATLYAWSQIFGTFRFNLDPVHTPTDCPEPELVTEIRCAGLNDLRATVTSNGTAPDGFSFVMHATKPLPGFATPKPYDLRPIGNFIHGTDGVEIQLRGAYAERWTPRPGERALFRAQAINANNELVPVRSVAVATFTADRLYYALAELWP